MVTRILTPQQTKLERKLEAFAEYLCARRGLAECTIKEQLGHSFVETTMVYLHAAPVAMQAQYRFFAPSCL